MSEDLEKRVEALRAQVKAMGGGAKIFQEWLVKKLDALLAEAREEGKPPGARMVHLVDTLMGARQNIADSDYNFADTAIMYALELITGQVLPPPASAGTEGPGLRKAVARMIMQFYFSKVVNWDEISEEGKQMYISVASRICGLLDVSRGKIVAALEIIEHSGCVDDAHIARQALEDYALAITDLWVCDDCMMRDMTEAEGDAHHASTGHSVSSK